MHGEQLRRLAYLLDYDLPLRLREEARIRSAYGQLDHDLVIPQTLHECVATHVDLGAKWVTLAGRNLGTGELYAVHNLTPQATSNPRTPESAQRAPLQAARNLFEHPRINNQVRFEAIPDLDNDMLIVMYGLLGKADRDIPVPIRRNFILEWVMSIIEDRKAAEHMATATEESSTAQYAKGPCQLVTRLMAFLDDHHILKSDGSKWLLSPSVGSGTPDIAYTLNNVIHGAAFENKSVVDEIFLDTVFASASSSNLLSGVRGFYVVHNDGTWSAPNTNLKRHSISCLVQVNFICPL